MLRSRVFVLALALTVLPFVALQAAPPPPCTCELCLEDPGVKCNEKNGSCVHLLRTGICLGQRAELATVQAISQVEPAPVCDERMSTPAAKTSPDVLGVAEVAPPEARRLGGR